MKYLLTTTCGIPKDYHTLQSSVLTRCSPPLPQCHFKLELRCNNIFPRQYNDSKEKQCSQNKLSCKNSPANKPPWFSDEDNPARTKSILKEIKKSNQAKKSKQSETVKSSREYQNLKLELTDSTQKKPNRQLEGQSEESAGIIAPHSQKQVPARDIENSSSENQTSESGSSDYTLEDGPDQQLNHSASVLPQLTDVPTMPQLHCLEHPNKHKPLRIIQEIGTAYNSFGVTLLDDTSGAIVKALRQQHSGDADCINFDILQKWLKGMGKKPKNWQTLVNELRNVELNTLADDIESYLEPTPSLQNNDVENNNNPDKHSMNKDDGVFLKCIQHFRLIYRLIRSKSCHLCVYIRISSLLLPPLTAFLITRIHNH